jgi:hypothetical protein
MLASLEDLLSPIRESVFLKEGWQRAALYIPGVPSKVTGFFEEYEAFLDFLVEAVKRPTRSETRHGGPCRAWLRNRVQDVYGDGGI